VIAKRIDHEPENDSYRALALYVAGIGEANDKVMMKWTAGCRMDDFDGALKEIEAVQAKNTRCRGNKSYHLVISWRPEDEAKLGPEIFQEIEREFAAALGLAEHQRQVGVHQNTDHIHLHVAYNLIHHEKYTRHSPFRDFTALSRTCRAMEEKYGLVVDKGLEENNGQAKPKVLAKVKSIEAQSGRETLFSYLQRHKLEFMTALGAAESWAEIHAPFLKYGLELKLSGNGLAIIDRFGKHAVKASDLDRAWSKSRLETRFGPFEPPTPDMKQTVKALETYTAKPLALEPDEQEDLYRRFQEQRDARKAALDGIEQKNRLRYADWRARWRSKRLAIKRLPMLKRDRQSLGMEISKREREELASLRAEAAAERKAARIAHPATAWREFLRIQEKSNLMTHQAQVEKSADLRPGQNSEIAAVAAPMDGNSPQKSKGLGW
jgi:hypothetical protein